MDYSIEDIIAFANSKAAIFFIAVFWSFSSTFIGLNEGYRELITFNLNFLSAAALIYFAMWQYFYNKRKHEKPDFEASGSLKHHKYSINATGSQLHEVGDLEIKFSNEGPGYASNLTMMRAIVMITVNWPDEGAEKFRRVRRELALDQELPGRVDVDVERFVSVPIAEVDIQGTNLAELFYDEDTKVQIHWVKAQFYSNKGDHWIETDEIMTNLPADLEEKYYIEPREQRFYLD